MSALLRRLLVRMSPPTHCGTPMDWDVFRASYVCHCGATK